MYVFIHVIFIFNFCTVLNGGVGVVFDPNQTLRAMPVVHPRIPTLCLVGAPNVGKSSLVRVLSSGKPEVGMFVGARFFNFFESIYYI